MTTRLLAIGGVIVAAAALTWLFFVQLPRRYARVEVAPAASAAPVPSASGRKIKARLFYVSDNGIQLAGVERDVPFAETPVEQARELVLAQLTPVVSPLVSALPTGTTLRSIFLTDGGQAYVDLSHEVTTAHTGGTLDELLTVYTIVNVLTVNLPAVTSVQLLVDGKESATLAGHVDVRQPLTRNLAWVQ